MVTFSIQNSQKYCTDETFLAVSVLAALSCILVPEWDLLVGIEVRLYDFYLTNETQERKYLVDRLVSGWGKYKHKVYLWYS